jgi:uncharacterized HAD superfamily protein
MSDKEVINLSDFDFGFSLVDADELHEVQQLSSELTQTESTVNEWMNQAEQWRNKAQGIYASVMPLLNNLSQQPEKEYIYWPGEDRVNKINAFKLKLNQILED